MARRSLAAFLSLHGRTRRHVLRRHVQRRRPPTTPGRWEPWAAGPRRAGDDRDRAAPGDEPTKCRGASRSSSPRRRGSAGLGRTTKLAARGRLRGAGRGPPAAARGRRPPRPGGLRGRRRRRAGAATTGASRRYVRRRQRASRGRRASASIIEKGGSIGRGRFCRVPEGRQLSTGPWWRRSPRSSSMR